MARIYNFSAGPATLPLEVLREAQEHLVDYHGAGLSLLEASHRGPEYDAVHTEAIENLRQLLDIPAEYSVLFMTGGATTQFALVPMNLLLPGETADYVHSGSWAGKAIEQARFVGRVNVAANTAKERPARMPAPDELNLTPGAAYLHLTSNETIAGTQWKTFPETEAPLVADMSSDILSQPLDVSRFGLIYAGAQKNLGPAGVTIVIARTEWLARAPENLPTILRYQAHAAENSLLNTPPCFPIYLVMLVTRWLLNLGGLEAIAARNRAKAETLYSVLDGSAFWRPTAAPAHRSLMNVTFRLPSEELEQQFIKQAAAAGLKGLKGHRSVGGVRASIYNAFPPEGVEALVACMREFERQHG
ncbi:MAG: 3-phosphoserine/phosphohydroxythreonine transaminase [Candidatus Marinimicrobia bacterium]|nr:3-phosphoserine/phosphohydroxythreonine transaminase [Candidatus Neomarinimicrobiota bacterium]